MSTDTSTNRLIINKLSKAQYEAISSPSDTELYLTPDTTAQDISDAVSTHNSSASAHSTLLNAKQDTLISGTNIKTINSNSILGSGNLELNGLPSQSGQSGKYLTTNGSTASWATPKISDLTDDTATNPIDKADTLTDLTATVTELNTINNKLDKQQISNCILEDPQNIKLELSNGTLTLKAGSVVCVPNGFEADGTTPKFDEVEIESDMSYTYSGSTTGPITGVFFVNISSTSLSLQWLSLCTSGTTPPTGTGVFYNTSTNEINFYSSGTKGSQFSFPICLCTFGTSVSGIQSIDQTFQSIGYIGSTVFVRKGLKVLIPNGRNDDGSLKNIEYTTTKVGTTSVSNYSNKGMIFTIGTTNNINYQGQLVVSENEPTSTYLFWYKPTANLLYTKGTGDYTKVNCCVIGVFDRTAGTAYPTISNFKPYTAINILKYSDKSQISSWAMPSSRYTNLTLGASGTTYTAPANGWFVLNKAHGSNTNTEQITLINYCSTSAGTMWTDGLIVRTCFTNSGIAMGAYIPVKEGDVVIAHYTVTGATNAFRFYYAEGEV